MWKDEYCIGVDVIDTQHKALFAKTAELAEKLEEGLEKNKQSIIEGILFLKQYALQHFADEEAYQKSINYSGFNEHKAQHKSFIQTLLQHERALKASNFAEGDVQALMKVLSNWLVFHVANSDQKIVGKDVVT